MMPMVESVEQARAIVESTHYPPRGRRGAAFGFAHDDYQPGDPGPKMREADARTLVIALIETERGLEQSRRSPPSTASTCCGSAISI